MLAFEKIDLTFAFNPFIFIAALILLGIYTFYIYRYTVPPVNRSKKAMLVGIRFLALLLILFIVFEPILTLANKHRIEPLNLVFIDDSRSIQIDDGTARKEKVKDFINESTDQLGNISEFYSFGSRLKQVGQDSLENLSFNEGSTNFSDILKTLNKSEKNISSVTLISDGVITSGNNPVFSAEKSGIPFFVVGVGDTAGRNDIEIRNVLFNEYIYAESPTTISASIRNRGFQGRTVSAALYEDNKLVEQKEIQLTETDNINFTYTPKTGGEKKLTFTISELKGEFTFANNKRVFYIDVLDNKLNILLISGSPSPDLTFIKNSLALDENLKVSSITQIGPNRYVEKENVEQKIDSAEIIFLLGFPTAETNAELLRKTADAINRKDVPYFITVTEYLDFNKLKAIEKELGFSLKRFNNRLLEVLPFVSTSDIKHPLLQNNAVNPVEAWNKLPPVLQPDADFSAKPESEVLAGTRINNVPVNTPLIVARKLANKRSVAVLAKNIWRWKLQTASKDLDLFDRFIVNSVKWLNTKEDQKQVNITTSKKVYPSGEEVEFNGQVYDETFNPVADAEVEVVVKKDRDEYKVLLNSIGGGLYEGTFQPESPGDYTFNGTAVNDNKKIGTDGGRFNIGEVDIEMSDPSMNIEMLSGLASVTGGKFFIAGEHQELFNIVKSINSKSSKEKTEVKELDLWSDERLINNCNSAFGDRMVYTKKNGNALKLFITSLFDLFAPRTCASCSSNLLIEEAFICEVCQSKLVRADKSLLDHEYARKFRSRDIISGFTSVFVFEKNKELQNIIHSIKYRNKFLTAKYLGTIAGEILEQQVLQWNIDLVIPVPLHRLKTAERGYNQSYYFAKGLTAALNIPLLNNAVKRKRYTATQTLMTLPEREQNMEGAFTVVRTKPLQGKNILIVDDVITTGSTIIECARVLKEKGADKIYALSIAISS